MNETRDRVVHLPAYDPKIVGQPSKGFWSPYYGYYGMSPYWSSGYIYPPFGLWL